MAGIDCANGELLLSYSSHKRFPLQSVMKLFTVAAVLDWIDQGAASIDDSILLTSRDVSPGPRRFANLIRKNGFYRASLSELMRNSVVESDSTSVDALLAHFGGPSAVQMFLSQKGLHELSVDRSERELQSEILGVDWCEEYCDLDAFETAAASLSPSDRESAWKAHATDERDSGTPDAACRFPLDVIAA